MRNASTPTLTAGKSEKKHKVEQRFSILRFQFPKVRFPLCSDESWILMYLEGERKYILLG